MIAMWKEISETIKVKYHHFLADFDTHPQRYFMRLLFVFLVSLVITITMFVFPKNIREAQVESLVYAEINSPKLKPLNINEASQTIEESKAISVLFSVPSGEMYQALMDIFHDPKKMAELNRPIYFYPLVYQVNELEQRYDLKQEHLTVIFFQNGKEANRLVYNANQLSDFPTQLIPELNRLPLANIKKLEEELGKEAQTTSTNTQLGTDLNAGNKTE